MHYEYWVLVTRNTQGSVTSLYSPDLKKELLESQVAPTSHFDYRSHIKTRITDELQIRHRIIFPKNFNQLENIPITSLQHWEGFKIKSKKRKPVCEVSLPISGHICNILAILTNLFITFMALKIANHNPDEGDSTKATSLAIAGSIFTSLINYFLYVLSGATETLNETGARLDNLCRNRDFDVIQDPHLELTVANNRKYYLLGVVAGLSISGSSFVAAVRQYQEFMLLAAKYLSLDPDLTESEQNKYLEIIKYLVVLTNIISSTYTATAFQAAFARKLIERFRYRAENEHSVHDALIQRLGQATHLLSDRYQSSRSDDESLQLERSKPVLQFSGETVPEVPVLLTSNSNSFDSKLTSKLEVM
jgi:hypothetical protein